MKQCAVCGKKISAFSGATVTSADGQKVAVCTSCIKSRTKNQVIKWNPSKNKMEYVESTENRLKCNVCGHLICYTDMEFIENETLKEILGMQRRSASVNSLFGSQSSAINDTQHANSTASKIKDYSKCPNCGSSDLIRIDKETFQKLQNSSANPVQSAADEIKKYKELLDSGIITQEEFDAKKKLLLGI